MTVLSSELIDLHHCRRLSQIVGVLWFSVILDHRREWCVCRSLVYFLTNVPNNACVVVKRQRRLSCRMM